MSATFLPKNPVKKSEFFINVEGETWGIVSHGGPSPNTLLCMFLGNSDSCLVVEEKRKCRIYFIHDGEEYVFNHEKQHFRKTKTSLPFPTKHPEEVKLVSSSPVLYMLLRVRLKEAIFHRYLKALEALGYAGPEITFDLTPQPILDRVNT